VQTIRSLLKGLYIAAILIRIILRGGKMAKKRGLIAIAAVVASSAPALAVTETQVSSVIPGGTGLTSDQLIVGPDGTVAIRVPEQAYKLYAASNGSCGENTNNCNSGC
jgi:hypothetical protein